MIERAGASSAGAPMASSASRQATGPAPQLTPIASAPAAARASAASVGLLPSASRSSSPNVREAITGTSDARRASSTARTSWRRSENVSRTIRSLPPSRSAVDLLPEDRPDHGLRHRRHPARRRSERSDGSADQRLAPAHLAGLAGQPGRPPIEVADVAFEAPGRESMSVGAERQGLDELCPGLQVLAMRGADQLRLTHDELLETGSLGHATAEQERAHAAVDQERPSRQAGAEAGPRQAGRGVGHQAFSVPRDSLGKISLLDVARRQRRAAGGSGDRDRKREDPSCRKGPRSGPLSCRRTCPELAPCRRDAGRLSWLQRAGPSATLDKSSSVVRASCPSEPE